jgi:hypothetical protein
MMEKINELARDEAFIKCYKTFIGCTSVDEYNGASALMANFIAMYGQNDYLNNLKSKMAKELIVAEFLD